MQIPIPPQLGQVRGRVAQLWSDRPQIVKDNPLLIAAGGLGLVGANQALGNPLGELLGGGEAVVVEEPPLYLSAPSSPSSGQPTPGVITQGQFVLNDEDKARALSNLKRKIATDLITIHALKGVPDDA